MTTDRLRETAVRKARILEDQKRVRDQVTDLIIECYDLPSQPNATPGIPVPADVKVFCTALSLFQPSDFDELVSERNIDDRCGYALCPNPNQKAPSGGNKVWNRKGGKDFRLLDKAEFERWCSRACRIRGDFVQGQLSSEPAWVRDVSETKVRLLDDLRHENDLAAALRELSIEDSSKADLESRLKVLSLERGDGRNTSTSKPNIVEKEVTESPPPPQSTDHDDVEGHSVRKVRFGGA